jgi:Protein of unknown function, DUF481
MQIPIKMVNMPTRYPTLCVAGLLAARLLSAQAAKPEPDVLLLTDGERLVGHFEQSDGSSVKFKSDVLGLVTVDWSKVKELHTAQKFAVIPKNVELKRNADVSGIPQGAVAVADQKITVTPAAGPARTVNVADADHVIEETSFENAVHKNPSFFSDWGGGVTLGASIVQATQESRTFTGAINLIRTVPDEDWLRRRNRTVADFSFAYSTVEQPDTPTVRTEIYHADVERDEYLRPSLFVFGLAAFDHNFSQGLDLQQTYAIGIGWSVIKRANESLDLKAGMSYIRQEFQIASVDRNTLGSVFEEDFMRVFGRGIKFSQQLIIAPGWTNSKAFTALGSAAVTFPVYKRASFSLGVIDNYLLDPPPGFRKNSFQAIMGLNYALR